MRDHILDDTDSKYALTIFNTKIVGGKEKELSKK
jgi:hypothetical protein